MYNNLGFRTLYTFNYNNRIIKNNQINNNNHIINQNNNMNIMNNNFVNSINNINNYNFNPIIQHKFGNKNLIRSNGGFKK